VDDLLVFWNSGVFYSGTASYPAGRNVRAAIIPLVADLVAARQVAGMASHSAEHFCSACYLKLEDISNLDKTTWPTRDTHTHRVNAEQWRDAQSFAKQETIFKETGIRWSELLRLPYWDPIRFTVIDSMHNLYLGLLKTHCREIWGISTKESDGEESKAHQAPERPPDSEMTFGKFCLYNASKSELLKCSVNVLWHLCDERDIRCGMRRKSMVKALIKWVSRPIARWAQLQAEMDKADEKLRQASDGLALVKCLKSVLITMCEIRGLATNGTRAELSKRLYQDSDDAPNDPLLNTAPQRPGAGSIAQPAAPQPAHSRSQQKKKQDPRNHSNLIGKDTITEIIDDRDRMQIPSWVNPVPRTIGSGKLSADQWKTLCTINFPVTLIRIWGSKVGLKHDMLKNFCDLAAAVVLAGQRHMTEQRIAEIDFYLTRYLTSLSTLYKSAPLKPNHHYALHLPHFLRLFGPVHAWRAFPFERFNYLLQQVKTDMKFGELEMTMMLQICRAANLRPHLEEHEIQQYLDGVIEVFNDASGEDRRGLRLESVGPHRHAPDPELSARRRPTTLQIPVMSKLRKLLNEETSTDIVYVDSHVQARETHHFILTPHAIQCDKIRISGIWYSHSRASSRDSNITFRYPSGGTPASGRIHDIFLHSRTNGTEMVEDPFLVVQSLTELSAEHIRFDRHRTFPVIGGRIFYNEYSAKLLVIRPADVLGHTAITPMDVPGIKKRCLHVLPLTHV
ncbi:hypothetical protein OBBRIDRAFT_698606, partial [Obba rivulosa]